MTRMRRIVTVLAAGLLLAPAIVAPVFDMPIVRYDFWLSSPVVWLPLAVLAAFGSGVVLRDRWALLVPVAGLAVGTLAAFPLRPRSIWYPFQQSWGTWLAAHLPSLLICGLVLEGLAWYGVYMGRDLAAWWARRLRPEALVLHACAALVALVGLGLLGFMLLTAGLGAGDSVDPTDSTWDYFWPSLIAIGVPAGGLVAVLVAGARLIEREVPPEPAGRS
ncbi:MAG TPA: hypothetical protein VFU78_21550 [Thermomicrobiales bacterium]|nr:hypothetical protein [Thermomicrobiales bacterium]